MYIDSHLIKDAICFDDTNSELSIHNEQENPVKSFIWSKRYGLVQYSFKDGKIYNRKITEKDLVENY